MFKLKRINVPIEVKGFDDRRSVVLYKSETIRYAQQYIPRNTGDLYRDIFSNINTTSTKVYASVPYADVYFDKTIRFNKRIHSKATAYALEESDKVNGHKVAENVLKDILVNQLGQKE